MTLKKSIDDLRARLDREESKRRVETARSSPDRFDHDAYRTAYQDVLERLGRERLMVLLMQVESP